jgi:23S rRNA pseudouridine2605 synthase
MPKERLQKILAAAGVDSRRNCEQLILAGLVRVNGRVVDTLPVFADIETDVIMVDGQRLRPEKEVYYLLNKPKGIICTNYDPGGRRKAIDLIDCRQRIFCVGRLDADTTGAIILTNDTSLSDKLTHPRHHLVKTYVVGIQGKITSEAVEKLKKGIWLSEGRAQPAKVKILKAHHTQSLLEIKITQSLNRQIRRITAKVGYKVTALKRIQIGRISLHHLGVGCYRELTSPEVDYLKGI